MILFLAHKKYSRSFVKRLDHWCHMDYFNNVLTMIFCIVYFKVTRYTIQVLSPILRICALHLTHPRCTHTPGTHIRNSGQPFILQRPGSSCGHRDSNSQPLDYESDSLTIRPWLLVSQHAWTSRFLDLDHVRIREDEDERRSYRFGMTRGWVINNWLLVIIFGWIIPLRVVNMLILCTHLFLWSY